jgi:predicted DNA-binding transcriptional regulator AlpA
MEPRLLNLQELADYIGYKPDTLRRKLKAGTFFLPPITGKGRSRRWDRVEVDRWIEAEKRKRDNT